MNRPLKGTPLNALRSIYTHSTEIGKVDIEKELQARIDDADRDRRQAEWKLNLAREALADITGDVVHTA